MSTLRVLIHASEQDAASITAALSGGERAFLPFAVTNQDDLRDALRSVRWGVVVCAHRNGTVDATATLASVAGNADGTPSLVVASPGDETFFPAWVKLGAFACVTFNELDQLIRTIEATVAAPPAQASTVPLAVTSVPNAGAGEPSLLDNLPNPAWRAGPTGKCTFFNRAWLEFTGRSLESELGDGWFSGIHPDDRDRCITLHWKAFARHQEYETEYRLGHRDGGYRWVVDLGRPIEENGEHVGFLGSCFDVTERRRAVEAMRESMAAVKTLLNATYDASVLVDSDGTILAANETAGSRLGTSADELIGADIAEVLPLPVRDVRLLQISGVLTSGRPTRFEDEASGVWYEITIYPMRDPDGRITGVALFEREITAYKRVEQALRDSERSYRQLFEASGHASLIVDPETDQILEASPWASDLLDTSRDELLGSTWAAITGNPELSLDRSLALLPADGSRVLEITQVRRDGSILALRVMTSVVEFAGRHAVLCVATEPDDPTPSARERHARVFAGLENLAGEIGQGYEQLFEELLAALRGAGNQTSGRDDRWRSIEEGLLRGRTLAHRLLLCARREPGMPERLALDDLLTEAREIVARRLHHDVTVEIGEVDGDLAVSADHDQIVKALTAVIANAAAVTPSGGCVVLTVATTELDEVAITVADQGPGLEGDLRSHFFEPFAHAGSDCWGSGLDLAMARGVVVGHGGSIEASVRHGGGCTVRICLPRALGERSGVRRWADLS
jgi:two-component system, cell cycle sensor histidine kinase and response regulator CckA